MFIAYVFVLAVLMGYFPFSILSRHGFATAGACVGSAASGAVALLYTRYILSSFRAIALETDHIILDVPLVGERTLRYTRVRRVEALPLFDTGPNDTHVRYVEVRFSITGRFLVLFGRVSAVFRDEREAMIFAHHISRCAGVRMSSRLVSS